MKRVKKSVESNHEFGTNSHFLELANHLPVNLLTLDRQYRYLYFNAAHANTMRDFYGTEISLGSVFTDSIPDADLRNLLIQNIDRCFDGETFEALITFPRKQGPNDKFRVRFVPAQGENNVVESVSLLFDSGTQYSQGFLPLYNLRPMLEVHANINNGINEIKDILIRDVFDRLNLGVMIVYPEKFSVLYANNALVGYLDLPCNGLSNIKLTDLDQFSLEKTQEKSEARAAKKGNLFRFLTSAWMGRFVNLRFTPGRFSMKGRMQLCCCSRMSRHNDALRRPIVSNRI